MRIYPYQERSFKQMNSTKNIHRSSRQFLCKVSISVYRPPLGVISIEDFLEKSILANKRKLVHAALRDHVEAIHYGLGFELQPEEYFHYTCSPANLFINLYF